MPEQPVTPRLLSKKAAANYSSVPLETVEYWVANGAVATVKIGKHRLIEKESLDAFVDRADRTPTESELQCAVTRFPAKPAMTVDAIFDRLDRATAELHAATQAALQLAKATVKATEARLADDDDWRRMPGRKERSEGGWSLRKLQMEIKAGHVRKKMVAGYPYYAASDIRREIAF